MAEHTTSTCRTVADSDAHKVALGRVYSLLLRLAAEQATANSKPEARETSTSSTGSGQRPNDEVDHGG